MLTCRSSPGFPVSFTSNLLHPRQQNLPCIVILTCMGKEERAAHDLNTEFMQRMKRQGA